MAASSSPASLQNVRGQGAATVARYAKLVCGPNPSIDPESKLWGKDESTERSVMFLIRLLRHFIDGPFRIHLEGLMENGDPDDEQTQKEIDAVTNAITKLVTDLGNSGLQSQLTRQLKSSSNGILRRVIEEFTSKNRRNDCP